MTKKPTLKSARDAALCGESAAAINALRGFADAGDASAGASLAELLAFSGDWEGLIPYAARLAAEPRAVYAANVFDDMVRLLGRAATETKDFARVIEAIAPARKATDDTHRNSVILEALAAFCEREGAPPHELIALWEANSEKQTPEQRRASYKDASENVFKYRPKLKGKPDQLATHLFALAIAFDQPDEIVRLYPAHVELRSFNDACAYARAVNDAHLAWQAVSQKLSQWYPVDKAQVAPVDPLLVDPEIAPLLTPERCELVLRTARAGRPPRLQ